VWVAGRFQPSFFLARMVAGPQKPSEVGLSATTGFRHAAIRLLPGIRLPTLSLMIEEHRGSDKDTNRPSGWWERGGEPRASMITSVFARNSRLVARSNTRLTPLFSAHPMLNVLRRTNLKAFRRLLQAHARVRRLQSVGHYPDYCIVSCAAGRPAHRIS